MTLHKDHETYRALYRAQLPPNWFVYEVCNNLINLPQSKLDYRWHLPACAPNTLDGQGFKWHPTDFLIVAPSAYESDVTYQTCLSNRAGVFLKDQLQQGGIPLDQCMVTHALRFPLPAGMTSYSQAHKNACQPYVKADAYGMEPKVILTFGSDALKALFGNDAMMGKMRGSVHLWNGIPVIPSVSPLTFTSSLGGLDVFQSEIQRAVQVACKGYVPATKWDEGYRTCQTADEVELLEKTLAQAELEALASGGKELDLAIDTEFGNDNGRDDANYLLTFQMAWGEGKAAIILFRGEEGAVIHSPEDLLRIKAAVTRMMNRPAVRLIGHHLRVDVEMPSREGMNYDEKLGAGFDTMLAHWLLYGAEGDDSHGLDHLVRKYASEYGAYWRELEDWLDSEPTIQKQKVGRDGALVFEREKVKNPDTGKMEWRYTDVPKMVTHRRPRKELLQYGYRLVPHKLLIPYALLDADVTWRIAQKLKAELETQPQLASLFKSHVMPVSLHLLDVERQGLLFDRQRQAELRAIYEPEYEQLLAEFRNVIGWQAFNPNSFHHRSTLLFSDTTYRDKKPAPEGARVLKLRPLYNTDKYPKEWDRIEQDGEAKNHAPSTKATTIDLLWQKYKDELPPEDAQTIKQLKQLSVLGKFLTTYLLEAEQNEHGVVMAGKNISNNVWADGRVRGHFKQMTTTGRYSMSAANLQTNPKKQEEAALAVFVDRQWGGLELSEYKRRIDDKKKDKLGSEWIPPEARIRLPAFKSCYIPAPGCVHIEVDFKTAEIGVLAYCSGDQTLIDIITQGRDMHAEVAARAFRLPLAETLQPALDELANGNIGPYEAWCKELKDKYGDLRVAAKTVNFGIMYGRGAYALAREICKTGAKVTVEDCEKIIEGFANDFPKAWAWLQANKDSAIENGYVANPYGFRRYFHGISKLPEKEQAAARREASNSPIQGCVAFLLGNAGINFYRLRYHTDIGRRIGFKVLLPIHDAFLIEVKKEHAEQMKVLIRMAMSSMNKIPGTDRNLETDIEVFPHRWGDKASHDELKLFFEQDDEEEELEVA